MKLGGFRLGVRGLSGFATVLLVMAVVAGCGGSDSGTSETSETSTADSTTTEDVAQLEQGLEPLYKGTNTSPVGGPVEPKPGQTIWLISAAQSAEASQLASSAVEAIGGKIGWSIRIFDGKYENSRALTGIQQAIAAGADGIILLYVDCEPVKAGLEEADRAEIPVVGIESQDCDPSLEQNILFKDGATFQEHLREFGQLPAKWLIAETDGTAKVILTEESDRQGSVEVVEGAREAFAECAECEIVDTVEFTGATFNTLQGKIEQALNQYPEATAFYSNYDAVMSLGGGAAAIRASGRLPDLKVAGGEGSKDGIELIRNEEGLDACSGYSNGWLGYEAVTLLARILAGQDTAGTNSGFGVQLCDREHNLPPKGMSYQPDVDYVSDYEEILGVK